MINFAIKLDNIYQVIEVENIFEKKFLNFSKINTLIYNIQNIYQNILLMITIVFVQSIFLNIIETAHILKMFFGFSQSENPTNKFII